jgi:multiple sugar transport system substrate-binding protein
MSILGVMLTACGGEPTATTAPAAVPTDTVGTTTEATATTATTTEATATTATTTEATATTATTGEAIATTGGTSGGALTLPADCTNVELAFWNGFTGPDGPFMQGLTDKFNAANPNVKVNMTTQSDLGTSLNTAAASDTLPEITQVNEDAVATQAFRNIIRPMDDVVAMMGYTANDFPKVAWDAGVVAGKRYAVPLSFVAMTMYWNQDLLTAAGLTGPPTNADDFAKAAAAMTANGNHGFQITSGFPVQQIFQMLLHQYGGTEFSADGQTAAWNSDAGVQALTWMKDAQTKYSEPNLEVDADLNSFKQGTVGMIWNGIWQVPNVTGESVSFKSGFGPPPQIGDQPAIWAGGPLLALPVRQTPDKCKDTGSAMLIKYLIDNSVEWAKAGNIPASNKARNSAEFKALPQASFVEALNNPVFPPPVPGIGDAFAPLGEAIGAVMGGKEADLKKALDGAAERSNAILEQNRTNFGATPKSP